MANCLEKIEFTYINDNDEAVRVTIQGDPLLSDTPVTKENEKEVVRQSLIDIYNDPNREGHNLLKQILNSTSSINYTTTLASNTLLLTSPTPTKRPIRFNEEDVIKISPTKLIEALSFLYRNNGSISGDSSLKSIYSLQADLVKNISSVDPSINFLLHEQAVDLESNALNDDGTEISFYDKDSNNVFLFNPDYSGFGIDNLKTLLNLSLNLNGINKTIEEISDSEEDFDITVLNLGFDKARALLSAITKSKTTSEEETLNEEKKPSTIEDPYSKSIQQLSNILFQQGVTTLDQAAAIYFAGDNKRPGKIRKSDFIHYTGYSEKDLKAYSQFLSTDAPKIDNINLWEGIDNNRARENDYQESAQVLIDYLIANGARNTNETPQQVRKRMLVNASEDSNNEDYYSGKSLSMPVRSELGYDNRTFFENERETYDRYVRVRNEVYSKGNVTTKDYVFAVNTYNKAVQFFGRDLVRAPKLLSNGYWNVYIKAANIENGITEDQLRRILDEFYIERDWEQMDSMQRAVNNLERYNEETSLSAEYSHNSKPDTKLRRKYFGNSDKVSARSILRKMIDSGVESSLASILMSNLHNNVDVYVDPVEVYDVGDYGLEQRSVAFFNTGNNYIRVAEFANFERGNVDKTLLHEIIHAITANYLESNSDLKLEFANMYQQAKDHIEGDWYSLSNIHEFMTGIFTSNEFQRKLKRIPPVSNNNGRTNLFDQIFDFFLSLFGLDRVSSEPIFYNSVRDLAIRVIEASNEVPARKPRTRNTFRNNPNTPLYNPESSYKSTASLSTPAVVGKTTIASESFSKSDSIDRQRLKHFSNRLAQKYGVNVDILNSKEISDIYDIEGGTFSYSKHRAFIDGDNRIVINSDKASFAEPIHELSHLILDGLKRSRNDLYVKLTNKVIDHPDFIKISNAYPELSEERLKEEAFVTILGERYNGNILSQQNQTWSVNNNSFFNDAVKGEKQVLSELFGLDSYRFFNMSNSELLNMSLNDIMDNFTHTLLSGGFLKEVDIVLEKDKYLKNGFYLKANNGQPSSFHQGLLQVGFSSDAASNMWVKSRSENFLKWHKGDIVTNNDDEPRIFFRGETPFKIYDEDVTGNLDAVVVRGNLMEDGEGYRVLASNVKSVNTLDYLPNTVIDTSIDSFANDNGYRMIGSETELKYSISKLKEQFADYEFTVNSFGNTNFIDFYKKYSPSIIELRNQLLNNNTITKLC